MVRKIIIAVSILIVLGIGVGVYQFNKPHEDLRTTRPDVVISADSLTTLYENDEVLADSLYLGKTLEVAGIVSNVVTNADSTLTVFLKSSGMTQVSCQLSAEASAVAKLSEGAGVVVRGNCSGMLMDVVLANGIVVQN